MSETIEKKEVSLPSRMMLMGHATSQNGAIMALGDGIRRNIRTISASERTRFINALLELNNRRYPGARSDTPPGGVTFWFKQDEVHQATHVHGGPAFLPWHRELCNRFEYLLREVDPELSLHYWDWNEDPHDLFTSTIMGSASGQAGEPLLSAGFYSPGADPFRADSAFDVANSNPYDPPRNLTRNLPSGAPTPSGNASWPTDAQILAASTFPAMRNLLEAAHDQIHGYIGGTIGDPHTAFRDPFVFLIHSNVDRLFAMWQTATGNAWRLDPAQVYGSESGGTAILENIEPWAGGVGTRPWWPPENRQVVKNCRDPSIVAPPCYDTLPNVPASVILDTPSLVFNAVPAGERTVRAAAFTVYACQHVHFHVTSLTGSAGASFELPLGGDVEVLHESGYTVPRAYIWVSFRGMNAGDTATGELKIHCDETNQDFTIPISATTIARPRAVVALVLDRSNSMSFDGGDGRTRLQVLQDSAHPFVDILQENNAVGMVAFDHDPHDVLPISVMGAPDDPIDTNRSAARQAIDNHTHNPAGNTAIGDGVERANTLLAPATGYDVKAMIVLTDGQETASKYISEVMSIINPNLHIFAIGLGTPEEIQPAALAALAHGHRGTLQMTGILDQDDRFLLTKFYLQVLANVTNEDIVEDPDGFLNIGQKQRIPFFLNEADIGSDIILLSPAPKVFRFSLETPEGKTIAPGMSVPGTKFVDRTLVRYYRVTLPALVTGTPAHSGQWFANLEIDADNFKKYISGRHNEEQAEEIRSARAHGVRYNVSVHSYSSLRFKAQLAQNSYEPGAQLTLRGRLTEYDLPVDRRATVRAEVTRPDGTAAVVPLTEVEPGVFEAQLAASLSGIYAVRLRAVGVTLRGQPFTRERLLTGAVWRGGDQPIPTGPGDQAGRDERLCQLVECLLSDAGVARYLEKQGIETKNVQRCLERYCRPKT